MTGRSRDRTASLNRPPRSWENRRVLAPPPGPCPDRRESGRQPLRRRADVAGAGAGSGTCWFASRWRSRKIPIVGVRPHARFWPSRAATPWTVWTFCGRDRCSGTSATASGHSRRGPGRCPTATGGCESAGTSWRTVRVGAAADLVVPPSFLSPLGKRSGEGHHGEVVTEDLASEPERRKSLMHRPRGLRPRGPVGTGTAHPLREDHDHLPGRTPHRRHLPLARPLTQGSCPVSAARGCTWIGTPIVRGCWQHRRCERHPYHPAAAGSTSPRSSLN